MAEQSSERMESVVASPRGTPFLNCKSFAYGVWKLRNQVTICVVLFLLHLFFGQMNDAYRSLIDDIYPSFGNGSEKTQSTSTINYTSYWFSLFSYFICHIFVVFCSIAILVTGIGQLTSLDRSILTNIEESLNGEINNPQWKRSTSVSIFKVLWGLSFRTPTQNELFNIKSCLRTLLICSLCPLIFFSVAPVVDFFWFNFSGRQLPGFNSGAIENYFKGIHFSELIVPVLHLLVSSLLFSLLLEAALVPMKSLGYRLFKSSMSLNYLKGVIYIDIIRPFDFWVLAATSVTFISMTSVTIFGFTALPQYLGPISMVYFGCIYLTLLGYILIKIDYALGLPMLVFLSLWAILIGSLGLTENHHIRTIPLADAIEEWGNRPMPIKGSFDKWLINLKSKMKFDSEKSKKKIPVIFVCLEGGGIYAAAHAALVLNELNSKVEGFRNHLFLISGVSGGSVGAAMFLSTLPELPESPESPEIVKGYRYSPSSGRKDKNHEILRRSLQADFLSPLVASHLFSDSLQLLIPHPVPGFDRARQLEYTLEGIQDVGEIAKKSIFTYWSPNGSLPVLAFNTTNPENGERVIISPLGFKTRDFTKDKYDSKLEPQPPGIPPVLNLANLMQDQDLSIGTSAFLSARFPLVTPPGSLLASSPKTAKDDDPKRSNQSNDGSANESNTDRSELKPRGDKPGDKLNNEKLVSATRLYKFVDGGYYENSGAATIYDFLSEIMYSDNPRKFSFGEMPATMRTLNETALECKFCVIRVGSTPDFENKKPGLPTGEITTPLTGLYNTRLERQYETSTHVRYLLADFNRQVGEMNDLRSSSLPDSKKTSRNTSGQLSQFYRFRIDPISNRLPLGWSLSKKAYESIKNTVTFSGIKNNESTESNDTHDVISRIKKFIEE